MSKKGKDPWVRMINVTDPVLHKKGYTLYKVTSKVRVIIRINTNIFVTFEFRFLNIVVFIIC